MVEVVTGICLIYLSYPFSSLLDIRTFYSLHFLTQFFFLWKFFPSVFQLLRYNLNTTLVMFNLNATLET